MQERNALPVWKRLEQHANTMKKQHMSQLFLENTERFQEFSIKLESFLFDYSKNIITNETMDLLMELAKASDIKLWQSKMLAGDHINQTEDRAVLHTALRSGLPAKDHIVDEQNISQDINHALDNINKIASKIREGAWLGFTNSSITDVVNIGIGGSNLGPQMVTEALSQHSDDKICVHYISNVDGTQITNVLKNLNPETTLFIISSKSFTTTETMTNAKTAMNWVLNGGCQSQDLHKHFVAVTANKELAIAFGIAESCIFDMWDWVGGRFSLWSAIGLPIAIALGFDKFKELLDGAKSLDDHFYSAPLSDNAPVILALLSIWNCTFLGAQSQAILPYDQTLHMLSAYLQQAEMESNGKSVNWFGKEVDYPTVPTIWGELGISGQHAFYQYLHQSKNVVPADFIGSVNSTTPVQGHHEILVSNFIAQTQALMQGVSEEDVRAELKNKGHEEDYVNKIAPHKVHQGNRPTNTILLDKITPRSLGSLIALYEHKIFVQGIILQICSFDQWGVELGKGLAKKVHQQLLDNSPNKNNDSSTAGLIDYYLQKKM